MSRLLKWFKRFWNRNVSGHSFIRFKQNGKTLYKGPAHLVPHMASAMKELDQDREELDKMMEDFEDD